LAVGTSSEGITSSVVIPEGSRQTAKEAWGTTEERETATRNLARRETEAGMMAIDHIVPDI
jgi:hypothetical protein